MCVGFEEGAISPLVSSRALINPDDIVFKNAIFSTVFYFLFFSDPSLRELIISDIYFSRTSS